MDSKAGFLGPQSENEDIFERLILDALTDHIYWRRNFHPEDPPSISEVDKTRSSYLESTTDVKKELFTILAELKKGVPFFSHRYLGHINSDLLIPAIVGYFAAMLYNQNNVVAESSPVTVVKELEYIAALAEMLGLPTLDLAKLGGEGESSSWGHLSSGGTTANIEAIWTARNVKFYPLSIRLLCEQRPDFAEFKKIQLTFGTNSTGELGQASPYSLLSLAPSEAMRLRRLVIDSFCELGLPIKLEQEIPSIQRIGMMAFRDLCKSHGLQFQLPKIVLPKTVHYSWPKGADLLGLGGETLVEIGVDDRFRLNLDELSNKIQDLSKSQVPILAVISICGTTEEGAIDPLHGVLQLRDETHNQSGTSFWIHSDAAFGGYFASMLRGEHAIEDSDRFAGINALSSVDSVAIDPHKLGYVPYPAGAVLYRDARVRQFIGYEAPYLRSDSDITRAFLGKWTLEGSRPGAAAVGCYLAQHCYPLNSTGHGRFLRTCIDSTRQLLSAFEVINADEVRNRGFRILSLFEPELNIVCYVLHAPGAISSLRSLNKLTKEITAELTVKGDFHANHYRYVVSETTYEMSRYSRQIHQFMTRCEIEERPDANESLVALRSVLMNALPVTNPNHFESFAETLCEIAEDHLGKIRGELIENAFRDRPDHRRLKVLILEDDDDERLSLKSSLELSQPQVSRWLEVRTTSSLADALAELNAFHPDASIVDLKIKDKFHGLSFIKELQDRNISNVVVYSAYVDEEVAAPELDELAIPNERRVRKTIPSPGGAGTENARLRDHRLILNPLLSFLDK